MILLTITLEWEIFSSGQRTIKDSIWKSLEMIKTSVKNSNPLTTLSTQSIPVSIVRSSIAPLKSNEQQRFTVKGKLIVGAETGVTVTGALQSLPSWKPA